MNIWCWIIPALVGIISGILGYLIGKCMCNCTDNSSELEFLKNKNSKLQIDLEACQGKLSTSVNHFASTPMASLIPFDAESAFAAFGKKIKQDDLKVVEGIGPKIEQLFLNNNITTWKALSEASEATCRQVLDSGGEAFKLHDPTSWPIQAKMCYEGRWKELVVWQDDHKNGKL